MADATPLHTNPPPKAGEAPSRNALRQRRHRAKKRKASVTRNAPVTPAPTAKAPAAAVAQRSSLPLTALAYGFFALGIGINVWNAVNGGALATVALPAAMGVLAEGVMFFLPAWAIRLPWGRQAAAWALLVFVSAFALTNSLRMASIVASDQAGRPGDGWDSTGRTRRRCCQG